MKPLTWEEALKLNGTPGYTRQDGLRDAEQLATLRREGLGGVRRSWAILDRQERSCEKHGAYESHLEQLKPAPDHPMFKPRWTSCPGCDKDIELEQEASKPPSVQMRKALEREKMQANGVGQLFADKEMATFRGDSLEWRKVQEYNSKIILAVEQGKNLVLCGPGAVGKTHVACALLRTILIKHKGTGHFTTLDRIEMKVRAAIGKSEKSKLDVYEELTKPDLLVIDNVLYSPFTDFSRNVLETVMNNRFSAACKPVVICTKLTMAELEPQMGDYLWHRVAKDCPQYPKEQKALIVQLPETFATRRKDPS